MIEQVIAQKLNVKQTEDKVRQKTGPEKIKAQSFQFSQDVTQARDEVGKSIEAIQQSGLHVEQKIEITMIIMKLKSEFIRSK